MVLVDSSVWIDYFNGTLTWQTEQLDIILESEILVMGDLILTEVLQGFRNEADFRKAKQVMGELQFFGLCGYEAAVKSADNYRLLRQKGVTVRKTIDVFIATACLRFNWKLLHDDSDFNLMESHLNLKVFKER